MLNTDDPKIRELLLKGKYGLEKENLRVLADGTLSRTPHPMPGDKHIVRDFSENQIEINTAPHDTVREAMRELAGHEKRLRDRLASLDTKEYLWPFSNPPYIGGPEDIPVAQFEGEEASKTTYREHLADVYGRYKMTFSGIHVNYSFDEDLLKREAELAEEDFRSFRDGFYVDLAAKMSVYGWLIVALTAASPVVDGSFFDPADRNDTVFTDEASLRCSKDGYWNFFDPVLDYTDISGYAESIEKYVQDGTLDASTELYYPVRLKPSGAYDVRKLKESGADHIELRMFDLDPLTPSNLDERDVEFAKLLMVYLAAQDPVEITEQEQINAIRNFKEAARFDLENVGIRMPGEDVPFTEAAESMLAGMSEFYEAASDSPEDGSEEPEDGASLAPADVLAYESEKIEDPKKRYAGRVAEAYGKDYVRKALQELTGQGRK